MNIDIELPLKIRDKAIKNTINMTDFLITDCERVNISRVFYSLFEISAFVRAQTQEISLKQWLLEKLAHSHFTE